MGEHAKGISCSGTTHEAIGASALSQQRGATEQQGIGFDGIKLASTASRVRAARSKHEARGTSAHFAVRHWRRRRQARLDGK